MSIGLVTSFTNGHWGYDFCWLQECGQFYTGFCLHRIKSVWYCSIVVIIGPLGTGEMELRLARSLVLPVADFGEKLRKS